MRKGALARSMASSQCRYRRAPRLSTFLADVVLQPCDCGDLLSLKLLNRGPTLRWRQTWIDLRDATLDMGDNARLGRRQQGCELRRDRRNLDIDFGTMGGIEQLTFGGEHAAHRFART